MHNQCLYANNAKTTLASAVAPTDTTILVANGSIFPVPGVGQYFLATIDSGVSIEIIKVGGVSGNSFINCVRGWENTTPQSFQPTTKIENRATAGTLASFARLVDRLANIASVDALASPALSDANSYLTVSTDDGGSPIVAVSNNNVTWRFLNYATVLTSGTLSAIGTSTSVSLPNASTILVHPFSGTFIIQFMTGNNTGLARAVTVVSGNTVSWATALPNTPAVGDGYQVYQSTNSTLNTLNSASNNALIYSIILGS
jgi:hypothetical protein